MQIETLYAHYLKSKGVSTDSRSVENGQIFFALSGSNFDGNKYADSAVNKGAMLAVVDNPAYAKHEQCFFVNNTLETLQQLALFHRQQFDIPVLGITGSNGKTTTKELIAAVLSQKFVVHYTNGNFNNHIGVPLTLLEMKRGTEIAIIEMGANHLGEIRDLCEISRPNLGLITNISGAHLEGFGSLEGVIQAKSELYRFLAKVKGTIFYNDEDHILPTVLPKDTKIVSYNQNKSWLSKIQLTSKYPFLHLFCDQKEKSRNIRSKLYGVYNQINMAAAISIGEYFDVSLDHIAEGVESYDPQNNRSQLIQFEDKTIILDAYNANPASMKASISHFAENVSGKKILILGEMAELGSVSNTAHLELLDFIEQWEWEKVLLIGEIFTKLKNKKFLSFVNTDELIEYLEANKNGFTGNYLLKGSRTVRLERLVTVFTK